MHNAAAAAAVAAAAKGTITSHAQQQQQQQQHSHTVVAGSVPGLVADSRSNRLYLELFFRKVCLACCRYFVVHCF